MSGVLFRQSVFWAFAFLVAAVPLVPFRYLVFPAFVPGFLVRAAQYAPVAVSLLVGSLWYWQWRGALAETLGRLPLGWPVAARV